MAVSKSRFEERELMSVTEKGPCCVELHHPVPSCAGCSTPRCACAGRDADLLLVVVLLFELREHILVIPAAGRRRRRRPGGRRVRGRRACSGAGWLSAMLLRMVAPPELRQCI